MVGGPRKAVQQDILIATENLFDWFMARDIIEAVSRIAGKKYGTIKIGKHLGVLCDAGFMESYKIQAGKDCKTRKYRRISSGRLK